MNDQGICNQYNGCQQSHPNQHRFTQQRAANGGNAGGAQAQSHVNIAQDDDDEDEDEDDDDENNEYASEDMDPHDQDEFFSGEEESRSEEDSGRQQHGNLVPQTASAVQSVQQNDEEPYIEDITNHASQAENQEDDEEEESDEVEDDQDERIRLESQGRHRAGNGPDGRRNAPR
jgi:hypothetical protein